LRLRTRAAMSRRIAVRSAPVTRAREKASKRSGGRWSASPTRKAASATGSVVPWAKTSLAARKRDTAWRTKSRIVVSSRAGFLTRAGRARFAARLRFWVIGKSYSDPTSMSGSIRGR
jgi:hypothetical protein